MVKADVGSAKWESTQMKKKGATKLRFYCGLCSVGCRDENGYKCHLETDLHIQRDLSISESSRIFKLSPTDREFRKKFLDCLMKRHFGQAVAAHEIYQELFPHDRPHAQMKATCWETLGSFVAQLRKAGLVEAQKGLKGWTVRISNEAALLESEDEKPKDVKRPRLFEKKEARSAEDPPTNVATKRLNDSKVTFSISAAKPQQEPEQSIAALFGDSSE